MSFNIPDMIYAKGRVELDSCTIAPNESVKLRFVIKNTSPDTKQVTIRLLLPEGWTADKTETSVYLCEPRYNSAADAVVTVTAGEEVKSVNKIFAIITTQNRPTAALAVIPIGQR